MGDASPPKKHTGLYLVSWHPSQELQSSIEAIKERPGSENIDDAESDADDLKSMVNDA